MFLTSWNKLKIKWLLWGCVITLALVLAGIWGMDGLVYPLINNPRCNSWFIDGGFWCSAAFIIGKIFSAKMWLVLTGFLLLLVYVKKTIKSGIKYKNAKNQFSLTVFVHDFLSKVRTNYAFLIFSSVLLAISVTGILKLLIGRPRPIMFFNYGGFHQFLFEWAFNSMPSGHTAATFAGLVMAGMLAPKIKPFTWSLAVIIGLSRIYIGAHWPSDVLLGAFIGIVAADLIKYWAFKKK